MKKVQEVLDEKKEGMTTRPPHGEKFAPVKVIRAKHKSASPLQDYTGFTLSTYKKFRMVIPNFL